MSSVQAWGWREEASRYVLGREHNETMANNSVASKGSRLESALFRHGEIEKPQSQVCTAMSRTLDALPGLRRGSPARWGIIRSLALGQRVAVWSARAGQTTRDITVRVSQTSTTVIACALRPTSISADAHEPGSVRISIDDGAMCCNECRLSLQEDERHFVASLVAKLPVTG